MKGYILLSNTDNFIKWYKWSLETKDCDPAIWMTNYLFDRFEHNIEQKLWISWIYGTTYHLPTTWVIWNEFPDFDLVNIDRLTDWNNKNYKRLRYQTDTKWNKGHLPAQFSSYKKWVNNFDSQEHCIKKYEKDFYKLWEEIKSLHKFGRYSTWFYMQTLNQCCNINVEPKSLMLHDYEGSRSHRNGLLYALDKQDWIDKKLSVQEYSWLETQAAHILLEVNKEYNTNYYEMETCLCSFKKLFRRTRGRYIGYYLDRQAEEIQQAEKDGWDGIDWQPLWDARKETLNKKLLTNSIDSSKMSLYLDNGILDATGLFENNSMGLERFM